MSESTHTVTEARRLVSFRSNLFVIGMVGSHLSKIVRLAFYLAEIQEYPIDYANKSLFYDNLKAVIRTAAIEGRHIGVVLTVRDDAPEKPNTSMVVR